MISDRNSCSLNSLRDPVIRNFGRKLLETWGITKAFRDLDQDEVAQFLPVMAELWDLNQTTQTGGYFSARSIDAGRLEMAGLIKRKEVAPRLVEEDDDPEVDGPSVEDRTIYSVDLDWLQERLVSAIRCLLNSVRTSKISAGFIYVGTMEIDGREVPCHLARGLYEKRQFATVDAHFRSQPEMGAGILFTGRDPEWPSIGQHLVWPLSTNFSPNDDAINLSVDEIRAVFRSQTVMTQNIQVIEFLRISDYRAILKIPGKQPLNLDGVFPVRAIALLEQDFRGRRIGVETSELIEGSSYKSVGQIFGDRWSEINGQYVLKARRKVWTLAAS